MIWRRIGHYFLQALEQQGISPDSNDLIRHNMVVFQDGEAALQVWLRKLLAEMHTFIQCCAVREGSQSYPCFPVALKCIFHAMHCVMQLLKHA